MARQKKITFDTRYLPGLFDEMLRQDESDMPSAGPVRKATGNRGRPRKTPERGMSGGEAEALAASLPDGIEPLTSTVPVPTLRFISFGSGSSGNCSYLGNDRFGILMTPASTRLRYIRSWSATASTYAPSAASYSPTTTATM